MPAELILCRAWLSLFIININFIRAYLLKCLKMHILRYHQPSWWMLCASQHIFNILLKINIPYSGKAEGWLPARCPMWEVSMYYNVFGDNNMGSSGIFYNLQQNTTPVHHKKHRKQFRVCVNWSHKQPLTPPGVQGPSTSQYIRPINFPRAVYEKRILRKQWKT